ncbi:protein-disulfide reductase DsbD [Methylophaga sp.]|uniref:protein-disulfide reductase DsbD n=1 Tax=Methylophaga sp. TaxID=2024840 RepID=UPI0023B67CCE|nr:protein-disulfide reductase DsbD [Methylophaga sp.]
MLLRQYIFVMFLQFMFVGNAYALNSMTLQSEDDFLEASEVFKIMPMQKDDGEFLIQSVIADTYYIYRKSLRLVDANGNDVTLKLPSGIAMHDEFFGDTEVYRGKTLSMRISQSVRAPLTLHWQGCAEAGICYPPQTITIPLLHDNAPERRTETDTNISVGSTQESSVSLNNETQSKTNKIVPNEIAQDQLAAERLNALGPVSGALLFLSFGLLLAFTPCSLPMIPIVSTMIIGSQANPRRAFILSICYVLAMASTYALIGVATGLAGANLQSVLQSPWLLGGFAALFLLFAASLFGLFELQMPSALMSRLNSVGQSRAGGSLIGAAILGFISALLVGPCMTAPLAGALIYIGQTGSALTGGIALFALGLGMGLPLLLIAIFGSKILPRPGAWMNRVRVAFGYVMVGMAIYMLSRFLSPTLTLLLWGGLALAAAIGLAAMAKVTQKRIRLAWAIHYSALLVAIWSTLMLVGAASGGSSTLQPLAHLSVFSNSDSQAQINYISAKSVEEIDEKIIDATEQDQWTMIDFYADWCVSCHVIERNVFGDPSVSKRLSRMQVLRPDVTQNDEVDKELMKHWQVQGPPTIILIGPDGIERRAQRTVGEVNAREFLALLDKAGAP